LPRLLLPVDLVAVAVVVARSRSCWMFIDGGARQMLVRVSRLLVHIDAQQEHLLRLLHVQHVPIIPADRWGPATMPAVAPERTKSPPPPRTARRDGVKQKPKATPRAHFDVCSSYTRSRRRCCAETAKQHPRAGGDPARPIHAPRSLACVPQPAGALLLFRRDGAAGALVRLWWLSIRRSSRCSKIAIITPPVASATNPPDAIVMCGR